MAQELVEMAKDLVMAMVQAKLVAPEDMQTELQKTYASLAALRAKEAGGEISVDVASSGAVDWKKSIRKHSVECLVCGAVFKQLGAQHLSTHDLDPKSYRRHFGIPASQPLAAKATTALRREVAQNIRPWEKAPTFVKRQDSEADAAPEPVATPKRAGRKKTAARV